jgi:hypothetical protein
VFEKLSRAAGKKVPVNFQLKLVPTSQTKIKANRGF